MWRERMKPRRAFSQTCVPWMKECWPLRLDQKSLRDSLMMHPKVLAALSRIDVTAPMSAFKGGAEPREQIKLI